MKNKSLLFVTVLSVIGIVLSVLLLKEHYRLMTHGFGDKSFCSINQWIDCDIVNGSSFSEIYGIPLAGLGLLYYLTVLVNSLIALVSSKNREDGPAFIFLLSFFAIGFTAYTMFVSLNKLHVVCLLCGGLYVTNILLFMGLPYAFASSWKQLGNFFNNYYLAFIGQKNNLGFKPRLMKNIVLTSVIYGVGLFLLFQANQPVPTEPNHKTGKSSKEELQLMLKAYSNQKPLDIATEGHPFWGNPSAKVKIVEFSDFQCPFCRLAALNLKPALAEYKNDVAFYFFYYPLDLTCNPYMQRAMHPNACNAARAAYCVDKMDSKKFWDYHDTLFNNQKDLSSGALIDYAEKMGLDKDKMTACLFDEEATKAVKADIEAGKQVDISGTPSIFINGRRLTNWNNIKFLRAVIEQELNK